MEYSIQRGEIYMKIIKRSGSEDIFDAAKIVAAIRKANDSVLDYEKLTADQIEEIASNVETACENMKRSPSVEEIQAAREVFGELYEEADSEYAANRLSSILKSLDTLEDRVEEIEKDALVTGLYETNMERLDLNIRVLTELIQEQIQYYIYYETTNMEELRMGIRADVESAITAITVILVLILLGAWMVSRRIVRGDRKSTRLNSSHWNKSRMPSSA